MEIPYGPVLMMNQQWDNMTHNDLWKNKAIAFLARSRQELWGKHNEEILAWFFLNGFKNSFIKDMLLGWNKRPKERSAVTWGFSTNDSDSRFKDSNLFFPPGIVIPYVVDKHLEKLIIYDHEKTTGNPCHVVPGSAETPVVFGKQCQHVAVVENIVHGLRLFQEFPDNLTVVVPDESPAMVPIKEPGKESQPLKILYFPDPLKENFSSNTENKSRIDLPHSEKKYSQASELVDIIRQCFFAV